MYATPTAFRKRWLDPQFRCVVPFTSAEFDNAPGPDGKPLGNTWFAFTAERPLAFFGDSPMTNSPDGEPSVASLYCPASEDLCPEMSIPVDATQPHQR